MVWLAPLVKVGVEAISFVWRHVTYIVRYKQSVDELKNSVKDLENEKDKIDHQCDEADKNLKNIEGKVTEWNRKVSEINITVEEFENDDGHEKAQSLNCYVFPYLWNRHGLGRKAKKMEVGVKKLINESPGLDEISYRENVTSNDATLSNSGFEEFGSTKSTMEKVMRELENSSVRMIGLYGEGGVGKSALIKEIARIARDKKLFNVVGKVEITDNPNLQSIQEEIAYVFGLQLEGEGENVRADCLRRRLKKETGNTLFILDDLWHKLDLNKLGIVLDDNDDNDDLSNDMRDLEDKFRKKDKNNKDLNQKVLKREKIIGGHKRCKILLTARQKSVLEVEMDVKSTFPVKPLDKNDALMFFQKLSGIHNMSESRKEIVTKYCAGLPMAIITVAKALRGKSDLVWEAALEKLEKQELGGVQTYMDISVKMSYDHLENEEIKSIFLLCAQMGHQPLIMDLVKCCFGLGILERVFSLWEARDKIKITIQKLKDSGLLLDGNSDIHFNMHDVVREAALSIAKKDKKFFTLRNGKLDEWPELKRCTFISICNCDIIEELPIVKCCRLNFFQIDTNNQSLTIPEKFFEGMKNLKVLILTGFHLKRFPPSIKSLLKLRMLCLERCILEDNLSIGELKKLRILSFYGSQLKSLPTELGCLKKLQLLDINDCSILEVNIPPNILSSLTHLEELYIRKSLTKMLVEGESSDGQNSILCELKNLHQLKVVDLSIPSFSNLPNHLFFAKLRDYKIVVGDVEMYSIIGFKMFDKHETFRVLALQLNHDTNVHFQEDIKLLFKTVQSLLLGKVDDVVKVVNELNMDGFPDLKHLSIIDSNAFKYVNSMELSNCINVFPNLESLCLYNLKNLEMISYGPLTVASFAKLKSIKVNMCDRLVSLYSIYMVDFSNSEEPCEIIEYNSYLDKFCASLKTIEVSECESLKEILQIPMNCDKVKFLKLQTLILQSLPSFTCFYTELEESCWPHPTKLQAKNNGSEEDQENEEAPLLFGEQVEIPNLESLNLCSLNIHKIWSDQLTSSFCFQNLIKLVVKECDKLTYLCSLSVASNLKKLKSLIISECPIMEKIFETKENSAEKVCVFPKLEEIHLSKMRRLRDIWHTKVNIDSFSSLISVNIEECNKLEKVFPNNMEGWFESLDNLKVSRCQSVEVIFEIKDSEEIDVSGEIDTNLQVILLEDLPKLKELWSKDPHGVLNFKKLRTIDVSKCDELRNLFPASMAKDVSKLERMSIRNCERMMEIISSKDASEANTDPLEFPELTYVRLISLPNIKHLCKGRHPIKCPKLNELIVNRCLKLTTFSKEITTIEEENFVFSSQKVFPNLENMEIDFEEAQKLLPKYQMHRLKELSLISVKNVDFLYQFPYRMPNLEKLNLAFAYSFEVLKPRANLAQQERLVIALELKELVVVKARIKDLGFPILGRLEVLSLIWCHELRNLDPPSLSFTYLTCLKLEYCPELKYLMTPSTAKSMVQLKTMKVINCSNVEEIVSNELSGEGTKMKIVFSKLITIELVGLTNMKSFCTYKDYEFEFPSLEILIVRECLKMEKFSEREAITPKLKNVFGVEGDENSKWHWEGNLNATIHKIFTDKVSFEYTEDLWLGYDTGQFFIDQLWDGRHCVQQISFGYLKKLRAWKCDSLEHIIPSHLLSCFHNLEELEVCDCRNAEVIFNMNDDCRNAEVIFNMNDENRLLTKSSGIFCLKILNLERLPTLEHVWEKDPEGIIGLKVLQEVRVSICERLKSLFPASVAKDLTRLEVLEIRMCKELQEIVEKDGKDEEEEGTTQELVLGRLISLMLKELPSLKYSIHSSNQSISNFHEREDIQELCLGSRSIPNSYFGLLESLTLDRCQCLSDVLLPFNLLPFLTNLETLEVRNCDSVKTIFDVKCTTQDREVTFMGQTLPFSLNKLTLLNLQELENVCNEDYCCPIVRSLELKGLPKLKYFYYSSLYCDISTDLESHSENQVGTEKRMSVGENGMKMILRREFERKLLESLKTLTLCFGSDLFEYEILKEVPNIEKLVVYDGSFKEMFCRESPDNVLQQLKVLRLESLEKLVSIGLENSWTHSFVGNIETFEVIKCSSLKNLVGCTVSFSNLTSLKVNDCDSLSYLLTSSTAKRLDKLKRMEIRGCDSIEEIVCKEDGQESDEDEIIFPQLTCLNLYKLWKLKRFYKGSLGFPSLEELSVIYCNEMKTLCVGTIVARKLSEVNLELDMFSEAIEWEIDPNSIERKKYLIKTQRESRIDLKNRRGLHEIWRGSLSIPNFFCFSELDTLIVDDCQFLSDAVLPFHLLPLLPKLETLAVGNCDYVKTIFDVKLSTQDTLVTLPLNNLVLSNLPNLENVWNKDPLHGILCMQHLEKVHIQKCKSLRSVFPASVTKDLKLEDLVMEDCERLVGIVAEDNTDPNLQLTLPCPYLRSLELRRLQKFTYFYYCSHKSDIYTHLESPTQHQLPNEKCLSLGGNGMKMIFRGEFKRKLLESLKALTLIGSDVFRCKILEQFLNIEKLVVCDGSFKKMFCCENPNNVLQQLKVLRLESLRELVSIGLENSWTHSFVGNIETFEVISCRSLKNLVACTVSFSNLTSLKVELCITLSYLLTSSTAKSLGKLKRMAIEDCESIEEIVCKEDGKESDEDEIIFPQLTCLNLERLSNLKRFYKGSLGFPSLEELSVEDCNKMISLCEGTIVGGKMCEVKVGEFSYAIQLETELNSTIRKKYLRKIASSKWEKSLELRDRTDLQEIWCLSLQMPQFCFTYLETLIVNKCKISSDAVLQFTLLPLLPKLKTLEVQNCDSVKTIFDVKCAQETLTFPLKKLVLRKLLNLETICNEVTEANPALPKETNRTLTFPFVTSLALCDLPNFIYDDAAPTFELIIPNLEHLTVGKKELKMIVDGEFQRNLLHKLKVLGLCFDIECDEFSEYGFLQQLPNVKKLVVWSSSFKVIFCHQRPNNNELLLQLNELRLESLEELVSIGLENSWTEPFLKNLETFEVISCSSLKNLVTCRVSFSNLTCLKVENCDGLSYLFTSSTAKSLGQLQRMKIKDCKSIEEIVSKKREESDEDEIIFSQLSSLKLDRLLNLRWFYRESLSFPCLQELSVIDCGEMVTLCPSTLKADKLSQVTIEYPVIPVETDLYTTMQKEFGRKTQWNSRIDLKNRRGLHEIWRGSLSIPNFCFSKLVTLIVDDCQFLSDAVLPFHLLPLLPKLETLEVRNCDSVKTIFDVNPSTQDTSITFPLKKLVLSKLPNLENVWNEDPCEILSMHRHLEQVFVDTCKCLKSVFPASVAKELVKLEDLVVEDCEELMAIVADESHENEEIIFERLQVLDLKRLKQLTCFCVGNFTLSFSSLEEVHVIKCSSMKSFSAVTKIDNPTKWYYSEYERPRMETDLNSALHRNFEEEAPESSSAMILVRSDSDTDGDNEHGDD